MVCSVVLVMVQGAVILEQTLALDPLPIASFTRQLCDGQHTGQNFFLNLFGTAAEFDNLARGARSAVSKLHV